MKKSALLMGLVLSLSMSGCNLFNKDNKNLPKKQDYSTEVTYEVFDEKFDGVLDGDLVPEGEENPSLTSDGRLAVNATGTFKDVDGKQISKSTNNIELNEIVKYDGKNDIAQVRTYGGSNAKEEKGSGVQKQEASADYTRTFQAMGEGEEKQTISVNEKAKEYYVLGAYTSNEPSDKCMDMLALPSLLLAFGMMGYQYGDETEKAKWHFYVDDDNLFTVTYHEEKTSDSTQYVDGEEVKYATKATSIDYFFQFETLFKGEEFNGLTCYFEATDKKSMTYVTEYEDTSDKITYLAGQVVEEETVATDVCKITLSEVKLSAIDVIAYTSKPASQDPDKEYSMSSIL